MSTTSNPSTESSSRENPCYGTDTQSAALNVVADDETSHLLAYAQFLRAERAANPALEREPSAPPERMVLRFASAEVVLLGSGLRTIERAVQRSDLKFVQSADRRLARTLTTHIAAVTILLNQERA